MTAAMRYPVFITYDSYRVAALVEPGVIKDVCSHRHATTSASIDHPRTCLPLAIQEWESIADRVHGGPSIDLASVEVHAPIPRPINVFGAPVNYLEHQGELGELRSPSSGTVRELGLFVKASGSVSGPDGPIELPPLPGREVHFEGEIAIVIGLGGIDLDDAGARSAIAGFTGALDVTLRLEADYREERSMRKSYRTFTPIGPAVLPYRDEYLSELELRLVINGEQRQHGTLSELVMGAVDLVKLASTIVELQPGDLILTGTPAGVGALGAGDYVVLSVSGLPPLELTVVDRGQTR